MTHIDPDELASWPDGVRDAVERFAALNQDGESFPFRRCDPELVEALEGRPVLAYHATRLLPEEIEAIRRDGLAPLSEALVEAKLDAAMRAGAITSGQRSLLSAGHMAREPNRRAQTWLILGRNAFTNGATGVRWLLGKWGGEAINMTDAAVGMDVLKATGSPSLALVAVPFERAQSSRASPSLASVFVGTLRGKPRTAGLLWTDGSLGGASILDVVGPGDPFYDGYPDLAIR